MGVDVIPISIYTYIIIFHLSMLLQQNSPRF